MSALDPRDAEAIKDGLHRLETWLPKPEPEPGDTDADRLAAARAAIAKATAP